MTPLQGEGADQAALFESVSRLLSIAADAIIAVGTRLQDFTTGSHTLFPQAKIVAINVGAFER